MQKLIKVFNDMLPKTNYIFFHCANILLSFVSVLAEYYSAETLPPLPTPTDIELHLICKPFTCEEKESCRSPFSAILTL